MKPSDQSRYTSSKRGNRRNASSERGYALLMAIFLVATLALAASMALPNILVEGQREREQEVIWRGNQYVRAIHLYYQKNGRFPQNMDDLTKASNNGTYFLRKQYTDLTDPDNQGEWRLIYASPNGQLTGSVRYHSLQEMALMQGLSAAQNNAMAAMAAANGGSATQSTGATGASGTAAGATPGQPGQFGLSQGSTAGGIGGGIGSGSSAFGPTSIGSGPVFGGYLVGVGCQLKRPSLIWYKGGKTYEQWEFIWNPLTVAAIATPGAGTIPGLSLPNTGGAIGNVLGGNVPGAPGAAAPGTPGASVPGAPGTTVINAPAEPPPPVNGEPLQAPLDSPVPGQGETQTPASPPPPPN